MPGTTSARGCGDPSRAIGLTIVASTATCAPCQNGSPLQTISMRRASWTGTWRFIAANLTFLPTRAPASWHTRAMARSKGKARDARTPDVAQAARWSPSTSNAQRQGQWLGPSGSARRNRRRMRMRKSELGTVANTSHVGRTVNTRAAWGQLATAATLETQGKIQAGASRARARHKPGLPAVASLAKSFQAHLRGRWGRRGPPRPPPSRVPQSRLVAACTAAVKDGMCPALGSRRRAKSRAAISGRACG